jgi:hypothetical protein
MKKPSDEKLSPSEVDKREKNVLAHFLTTKPEPHKPLGKTAQAKRRKRERREK